MKLTETLVVKMQFGSHVYGTNLPTSDLDFKGVYVPTADDILLQRVKASRSHSTKEDRHTRNSAGDIDFETFSLQQFFNLLLAGQTVQVSMLFTPQQWIFEQTELWDLIRDRKHLWLHSGVAAFAGYCRQQANKYCIKGSRVSAAAAAVDVFTRLVSAYPRTDRLRDHWEDIEQLAAAHEHVEVSQEFPNRMIEVCNRKVLEGTSIKDALAMVSRIHEEYGVRARQAQLNENVDWKAMMHAVRVCYEAQELLTSGNVTYPRPEADLLLRIRKGEVPYQQVAGMLEDGLVRLTECQRLSHLPAAPDFEAAKDLVRDTYRAVVLRQATQAVRVPAS